jgi:glycyl-tRNA synthetase
VGVLLSAVLDVPADNLIRTLRFTDWMCKDVKTHEIFRADHLVEAVLEARLKGDKEARGQAAVVIEAPTGTPAEIAAEEKKRKKKKTVKSEAVKLDDKDVAEYEYMLAQVSGVQE